jgi:hypothetical protein
MSKTRNKIARADNHGNHSAQMRRQDNILVDPLQRGISPACSDEGGIVQVKVAFDSTTIVHDFLPESFSSSRTSFGTSFEIGKASDDTHLGKLPREGGILAQFDQLRRSKSFDEATYALDLAQPKLCVRNTFIHLQDAEEASEKPEFVSAPSVMMTKPFSTKYPSMEPAHIKGDCRPCAYFSHKTDGCRWGENCSFCHLCPPGALKRKKREKIKALQATKKEKRHGKGSAI